MKISKTFVGAVGALGLMASLSACQEEPVLTTGHCEADNSSLSNTDLKQRFKIVDNQTGEPLHFTGAGLKKGGDTYMYGPSLAPMDPQENGGTMGWEYDGSSFEVHLNKKDHSIKTCSVVNNTGDGPVYGPKP